jgi:hypothetical protein
VTSGQEPTVTAAVEGDLDEAVVRRIANHAGLWLGAVHGRRGKQLLLRSIKGYNNAARQSAWVVLVDLNGDCECAPPFVQKWLPDPAPQMCFRAVVRSVEAWLLADRERIAGWLDIPVTRVPQIPDKLDNPKGELIRLARRSRRPTIREDLLPREGSGRVVGPLYTARMIEYVEDRSNGRRPGSAASVSDSLARCIKRLSQLHSA